MMHPINKKNFGEAAGKIAVKFHDGAAMATGYIVKQKSKNRFVVTADGEETFDCVLADTVEAATVLVEGVMTIEVTTFEDEVEHVKAIYATRLVTVEGSSLTWKLGVEAAAAGAGTIATIA